MILSFLSDNNNIVTEFTGEPVIDLIYQVYIKTLYKEFVGIGENAPRYHPLDRGALAVDMYKAKVLSAGDSSAT